MTRDTSIYRQGSEFNPFLFAPVGEDMNGMVLSVLSALARLNIDPWQEAAKLAGLSRDAATKRLASVIATLPDGSSTHLDSGTIAARLIALLPRSASVNMPSRNVLHGASAATQPRSFMHVMIFNAIFMIFVFGVQYILASREPPAGLSNAPTPVSDTVSPQTLRPGLGR
jgi:hypothetical protein